jgi:regulator of nucleoside diphosphate kinase
MYKPADCQLTTKDANLLEVMLQRHGDRDGPFVRLLRRKLSAATVVFQDGIDARAATLNSRIEISVDGGPAESRILAYGGEDAYPGIALPITTLLGLSLLGLTAPRTIVCERPDGATQEVHLRRILHQPEAARRSRVAHSLAAAARPEAGPSVVALAARRRAMHGSAHGAPHEPDGDDPGPQAA